MQIIIFLFSNIETKFTNKMYEGIWIIIKDFLKVIQRLKVYGWMERLLDVTSGYLRGGGAAGFHFLPNNYM